MISYVQVSLQNYVSGPVTLVHDAPVDASPEVRSALKALLPGLGNTGDEVIAGKLRDLPQFYAIVRWRALVLVAVGSGRLEAERYVLLVRDVVRTTFVGRVESIETLAADCRACFEQAEQRFRSSFDGGAAAPRSARDADHLRAPPAVSPMSAHRAFEMPERPRAGDARSHQRSRTWTNSMETKSSFLDDVFRSAASGAGAEDPPEAPGRARRPQGQRRPHRRTADQRIGRPVPRPSLDPRSLASALEHVSPAREPAPVPPTPPSADGTYARPPAGGGAETAGGASGGGAFESAGGGKVGGARREPSPARAGAMDEATGYGMAAFEQKPRGFAWNGGGLRSGRGQAKGRRANHLRRVTTGEVDLKASEGTGILVPVDFSGMDDLCSVLDGASLLNKMDVQTRNALLAQVRLCQRRTELLTVLHRFRDALRGIPLPRPQAVPTDQALKDAAREVVVVNGKERFEGDALKLTRHIGDLLRSIVASDKYTMDKVVHDVVRAASRTAHGGDAYAVVQGLLVRPAEDAGAAPFKDLLTPDAQSPPPIEVWTNGTGIARRGDVVIRSTDRFLLRDMDGGAAGEGEGAGGGAGAGAAGEGSSIFSRIATFPGLRRARSRGKEGEAGGDEDLVIETRVHVRLGLLSGTWERTIDVTSPLVEATPGQINLLGAGHAPANGTYNLQGFRAGRPFYSNAHTYELGALPDHGAWCIRDHRGQRIYMAPGAGARRLPPAASWAVVVEGAIAGAYMPQPTLMHVFSEQYMDTASLHHTSAAAASQERVRHGGRLERVTGDPQGVAAARSSVAPDPFAGSMEPLTPEQRP